MEINMIRDMRRLKQQLSKEECERILREQPRGVLAVLGDEGYPYTVPLNFVYADGCIYFHSALEGHKIEAVRKYDKASFCVLEQKELSDDGWSYFFNSVIAFGRLSEITDTAEKNEKLRALGLRYFPTAEMADRETAKHGAGCAMVELRIEHLTGKRVHER